MNARPSHCSGAVYRALAACSVPSQSGRAVRLEGVPFQAKSDIHCTTFCLRHRRRPYVKPRPLVRIISSTNSSQLPCLFTALRLFRHSPSVRCTRRILPYTFWSYCCSCSLGRRPELAGLTYLYTLTLVATLLLSDPEVLQMRSLASEHILIGSLATRWQFLPVAIRYVTQSLGIVADWLENYHPAAVVLGAFSLYCRHRSQHFCLRYSSWFELHCLRTRRTEKRVAVAVAVAVAAAAVRVLVRAGDDAKPRGGRRVCSGAGLEVRRRSEQRRDSAKDDGDKRRRKRGLKCSRSTLNEDTRTSRAAVMAL